MAAQALLRNVTYENVSDDPSVAVRTVEVVLSDGDGGTSAVVNRAIQVSAVNDPPVVMTNEGLAISAGGQAAISTTQFQVTDVDNPASELVYTLVTAPSEGTLQLSSTPLSAGSTLTQADIDGGLLAYQHAGGVAAADSFVFTVSDGSGGTIGADHLRHSSKSDSVFEFQ